VKSSIDRRTELESLSTASSRYVRDPQSSHRNSSQLNLPISAILAGVAGLALAFSTPLEHHCAATFRLDSPSSVVHAIDIKTMLTEYVSRLGTDPTQVKPGDSRWWTDTPAAGILRLGVTTTDRRKGVEEAAAAAQGFLTALQERRDEIRRTPSESEGVLSDLVAQLKERVAQAQAQVDSATASLPSADPRIDRNALVQRWRGLRTDFAATRAQLAEAAAGVDRLRSDFEPTHGIVRADDRRRALESDAALQQDLRELEVKLAELKLHLLNVWQQSSARLEQLSTAIDDLAQTASTSDTTRLSQNIQTAVLGLVNDTNTYRQSLTTFTEVWTNEFTSLQRMEVDPASGELLDRYQRVRSMLSDFLFAASQGLSAVRSHLNVLGEQASDNARHHVLQSNLTRAFQAAQTAHHRFEFAAGGIDTPDNFRLDAALRSARGLRRRILEQIQHIEQRLQTEAIDRAKTQRVKALAEAEHAVEQTRATSEQTIEQLFSVQDGLIHAVGLTEGFLHAALQAELAANRLQNAQDDLALTDRRLAELVANREAASADIGVELVSCGVIGTELNLEQRLRLGGIGFVVTLVAVLAGQWWIARRS
jgi:hypothetical protein